MLQLREIAGWVVAEATLSAPRLSPLLQLGSRLRELRSTERAAVKIALQFPGLVPENRDVRPAL